MIAKTTHHYLQYWHPGRHARLPILWALNRVADAVDALLVRK